MERSSHQTNGPSEGPTAVHAHTHIALCPNEQLHVRVGNVCLHLCRRDFCQLARAVMDTLATMEMTERKAIIGDAH